MEYEKQVIDIYVVLYYLDFNNINYTIKPDLDIMNWFVAQYISIKSNKKIFKI